MATVLVAVCGLPVVASASAQGKQAKPALTSEVLRPHAHRFDITAGGLAGKGADFVRRELATHHVVMLGEYHGSKRLSEFTRMVIPVLHAAGCRRFGLEVGPTAAEILSGFCEQPATVAQSLRELNTKWCRPTPDYTRSAIPFFINESDATFLRAAAERDWQLIGLDQEFIYGLGPVLTQAHAQLPAANRDRLQARLDAAVSELDALMASEVERGDDDRSQRATATMPASATLSEYLEALDECGPAARAVAVDVRESLEIYRLYGIGDWWRSNRRRIRNMKRCLQRGLERTAFRWGRDRMFVKMGGVHTGRGLSPLMNYELGNTLAELCELHGVRSLHIDCMARFEQDGENVVDDLEQSDRNRVIRELADVKSWTIVDLRPLHKALRYEWYVADRWVRDHFLRNDWVLLPPAEPPTRENRDG